VLRSCQSSASKEQLIEHQCRLAAENRVQSQVGLLQCASPGIVVEPSLRCGSSPDDEALVEFARFMGYELFQRNQPLITVRLTRPPIGGIQRGAFIAACCTAWQLVAVSGAGVSL